MGRGRERGGGMGGGERCGREREVGERERECVSQYPWKSVTNQNRAASSKRKRNKR